MNCLVLPLRILFQFLQVKWIEKLLGKTCSTLFLVRGVVNSVDVMKLEVNVTSLPWHFALKPSLCDFKSLFWDSCTSLDSCPVGRIAVEIVLDLWIRILCTLMGIRNHEYYWTYNLVVCNTYWHGKLSYLFGIEVTELCTITAHSLNKFLLTPVIFTESS